MRSETEKPETSAGTSDGTGDSQAAKTLRVLFVCTGNTCRSPMAEAFAKHWLIEQRPAGVLVEVLSAGVYAGPGSPMTTEAQQVLRSMGVDPGSHRSQGLTPSLLEQADAVLCMTDGHAQAVASLLGSDGDYASRLLAKVRPLDPAGDVPDPIGGGLGVYQTTAQRLAELVAVQMQELLR